MSTILDNEYKVAFVGMVFPPELEDFIFRFEKGQPQIAASKLGWSFIKGLQANLKGDFRIISILMVSAYPRFKKLWIRPSSSKRSPNTTITYPWFVNIPLIKRFFIMLSVGMHLISWLARGRNIKKRLIFTYAVYLPSLIPVTIFAKLTGTTVYLIVPDLPEYMQPGVRFSFFVQKFRELNIKLCYFFSQFVDGYVLLTAPMAERFNTTVKPWAVMEGCADYNDSDENDNAPQGYSNEPKKIFYAGTLNAAYGIRTLLDAFQLIDRNDVNLIICGKGDYQHEVEARAAQDSRIKYLGVLKNADVLKMQKSCDILVNPRLSADEYTRYSFPSKTLEYLLSGRPVLCCRLPGIPDRYWDYLIAFDQETPDGFARTLSAVLDKSRDELDEIGRRGHNFARFAKSPSNQIATVLVELGFA